MAKPTKSKPNQFELMQEYFIKKGVVCAYTIGRSVKKEYITLKPLDNGLYTVEMYNVTFSTYTGSLPNIFEFLSHRLATLADAFTGRVLSEQDVKDRLTLKWGKDVLNKNTPAVEG